MADGTDVPGSLRVGFVGAGQMGEPMVETLLATGRPLELYVRRPEVAERLAARGATIVGGLTDLGSCDVVISCLFSDAQLVEVAIGEGGDGRGGLIAAMKPGAVLASHTTGTLGTLDRLAKAAAERGVHIVEAPVSGGPDEIRAGRLTVLLGGEDAGALDRVAAAVAPYASPVLLTGGLGTAMKVKLINNLLFCAHTQLAAEALRLAADIGVEAEPLLAALAHCSGMSAALGYIAAGGGNITEFGERAAPFMRKDVAAGEATAGELGADIGLLGHVARSGPLPIAN